LDAAPAFADEPQAGELDPQRDLDPPLLPGTLVLG